MASATFLTLTAFKALMGFTKGDVKVNPATGKRYLLTDTGLIFKVQQDINPSLPMRFLVDDTDDLTSACLVNVEEHTTEFSM